MSRRIVQLLGGLVLYGVGCALLLEAGLGVDPWTVLAEGTALRTGIGVGWVTNVLSVFVLLLWIPLRQRPGAGTVLNVLLVGTTMQLAIDVIPPVSHLGVRIAMMLGGVLAVAVASGAYIGARFGPGPRDGLMTGLHARLGMPIWVARTGVELSVLALGWLLGGTVGIGTLVFAISIGPLVQRTLALFDTRRGAASTVAERPLSARGTPGGRSQA